MWKLHTVPNLYPFSQHFPRWQVDTVYIMQKIEETQTLYVLNSLRPRRNRRHFAGDIFKCISLNENVWIALKFSLEFVPKVWINNIPALFQIMAWHWPGDKPLSEPMMISLLMHICVTRPQWVKGVAVTVRIDIHKVKAIYQRRLSSFGSAWQRTTIGSANGKVLDGSWTSAIEP